MSLETAMILPPFLILLFFLISLPPAIQQELCFRFALDQAAEELALVLPAGEAILSLDAESRAEKLLHSLLSAEEKNELQRAAGDLASSLFFSSFLERRVDYWLQEAATAHAVKIPPHRRQLLLQWNSGGKSLQLILYYELETAFKRYERSCEAMLPLWLNQSVGAAEQNSQETEEDLLWSKDNFTRGRAFRDRYGANLPFNYPVICRFENDLALALRSMDLTAPFYADPLTVERAVGAEVERLRSFAGAVIPGGGGREIRPEDILSRSLVIVIPANSPQGFDAAWREKLRREAAVQGIALRFDERGRSFRYGKP